MDELLYCSPEDIRPLTELVYDEPDEYFTPFIKKATAYVNSRLSRRYQMPLEKDNIPPIIAEVTADLAGSYILDKHTTERYKDQTHYSDVLFKRALQSLDRIMKYGELDFMIPLSQGKGSPSFRPSIQTTTYKSKSLMDDILNKF